MRYAAKCDSFYALYYFCFPSVLHLGVLKISHYPNGISLVLLSFFSFPTVQNCPACFEEPKERDRVKKLLQQEEAMVPGLFYNLRRALVPLMHDDTYEVMTRVQKRVQAAGTVRTPCTRRPSEAKPGQTVGQKTGTDSSSGALEKNKSAAQSPARDSASEPALKRSKPDRGSEKNDGNNGEKIPVEISLEGETCTRGGYCPPCYELA
jgi:hypothetical protein